MLDRMYKLLVVVMVVVMEVGVTVEDLVVVMEVGVTVEHLVVVKVRVVWGKVEVEMVEEILVVNLVAY